jgi:glutathione S-transferase
VDDGYAIWESLAVLEYLDDRFQSGAKLYPGDAASRGRVRRLIMEIDSYLYNEGLSPIVDELFWSGDKGPNAERVAKAREKAASELEYLAKELKGKFLAGDTLSAADCVLGPCLQYCKRITFRKPETKLDELIPPALRDYNQRIEALAYFDKTYPPHWR